MSRISHFFLQLSAIERKKSRRWRNIYLALAFMFSLGSVANMTLANAAPSGQETPVKARYYLQILRLPLQVCVGQEYTIWVTPLAEFNGTLPLGGGRFVDKDHIITGVLITTSGNDKNILSVKPEKQSSGKGFPKDLLQTTQFKPDQENYGEVTFTLKGIKTGVTNLYFTAKVPERFSTAKDQVFGPESKYPPAFTIKVVNCKYKVQIYYSMLGLFASNTSGYAMGYMETVLKTEDGENYHGEGVLATVETRTGPGCNWTHSGFKSKTTITGKLTGGQLELGIQYLPGQYTFTGGCLGRTSTSTGTEDPSGWMQTFETFPESGGSKSKRLNSIFIGWLGTATITVTPVSSSGP